MWGVGGIFRGDFRRNGWSDLSIVLHALLPVFFTDFMLFYGVFISIVHVCFCTHAARVIKLLLQCINAPMSVAFLLLVELNINKNSFCAELCVCAFLLLFLLELCWASFAQFLLCLSAVAIDRATRFCFSAVHLLCILDVDAICRFGYLFVVLCLRFFVTLLLVLVVGFVCCFLLVLLCCYLRRPCECIFDSFAVLVCFSV